jgi:ribosome-binding factor A
MSPDLKIAKVYISIFGDDVRKKKSLDMLEVKKPSLRAMLGRSIRLRFTPELTFYLDQTIDRAMKLENIFKKIHERDSEKETHRTS